MSLFGRASSVPTKKADDLPSFFDVARQQSELIHWVGTKIQEHEASIQKLTQQIQELLNDVANKPAIPFTRRTTPPESVSPNRRRMTEHSSFSPRKWSMVQKGRSTTSIGGSTPKTTKRQESRVSKASTKSKSKKSLSSLDSESVANDIAEVEATLDEPIGDGEDDESQSPEKGARGSLKSMQSKSSAKSQRMAEDGGEDDNNNEEHVENDSEHETEQEDAKQEDRLEDLEEGMEELQDDMDEETKNKINEARARKQRQSREEEQEQQNRKQSLKSLDDRRPSQLDLVDPDNASNDREAPEYALVSDINQKFEDFSQYVAEEMERLDSAICKELEARMQDIIADTVQQGMTDLVQERLTDFEQRVQSAVDEKIAASMSDIGVNALFQESEGDVDEVSNLLDVGGVSEVNIVSPRGSSNTQLVGGGSVRGSPVVEEGEEHEGLSDKPDSRESKEGRTPSKLSVKSGSPDVAVTDTSSVSHPRSPELIESKRASVTTPNMSRRGSRMSVKHDNPEMFLAIKSLHAKFAPFEEALAELKPLRLQVPTLQSEMENLSNNVAKIYQALEEEGGANNKRFSTHLSETWSDNGELGVLAGAHAHSPEDPRIKSVHGRGGSLGRYMSQGNVHMPTVDPSKMDTLLKRVEKLEIYTKPVERFPDYEQLVTILEDRVKELDSDYRTKIKELDLRVGLQQSLEEREAASAQKVYESWNLDNQVDVILSVVQGEMRDVRAEINDMIKAAVATADSHDFSTSLVPDGQQRGSVSQITTKFPLHDSSKSQRLESPSGGSRRERRGSRSRSTSPSGFKEQEEKIKRLQECYQQCTLKIAGLKSGNRHAEQQVGHSIEQIKKLIADVEQFGAIAQRNECRLDYLSLHVSHHPARCESFDEQKDVERATTFQGAVGRSATSRNTLIATATPMNRENSPVNREPGRKGSFRLNDDRPELQRSSTRSMRRSSNRAIEAPTPKAGDRAASPRLMGQENQDPNAVSQVEQIDINTGRVWRLGKKVNDLDNEMSAEFKKMKDEMDLMEQKMNMFVTFLPRRLRRMVERVLTVHKKDNEEDGEKKEKGDSKHVAISEKAPEIRTFNADPDTANLPWQCVGEPEQKWLWCLQPRNDMGRDLARQFELMEDERKELEENIESSVDNLRQEFTLRLEQWRPSRPQQVDHAMYESSGPGLGGTQSPTSPMYGNPWGGGVSSEVVDKINRRLDKAIMPQIATLEDRLERLVKDMIEVKNRQETDHHKKADKDEIQLLKMRLQVFEKFDPKQIAAQVENLEVDGKHYLHLIDQLAEQCRKIESYAAHRQDMTKCKAEVQQVKAEVHKLQGEQKEISSSVFNSNRQLSTIVLETKTNLEKHLTKLEVEKVSQVEYAALQEKIVKLDSSMRDNRQILSDSSGGADMNQVVKRIILNMEDKLMLLEKKMDLILEGRSAEIEGLHKQGENSDQPLSRPPSTRPGTTAGPFVNDTMVENLGNEIASISEAVTILKQEITLSKVNMDSIREQGAQASELAQRLNILVEAPNGDGGTTLSLNRVQVMVAAAARQLVAGSKWVTQDIFDTRLHELRKECIGFLRQVQAQVEEMSSHKLQPQLQLQLPKKLPSVVADKQGRKSLEDSGIGFGLMPKRQMHTAPAPLSARR